MLRWTWFTLAVVCLIGGRGLGFRHLWQDELETAERARAILSFGYPTTFDGEGRLSTNTGGREVEDGNAHRYTPWIQFYAAASGLALSDMLGGSRDAGVRLPSFLAHGTAAALVTYGAHGFVGLSPPLAAGLGIAWGLQSVRLLHARTARYHGLMDLWAVLTLFGLAALLRGQRSGAALFSVALALQWHTHPAAALPIALALFPLALAATFSFSLSDRPRLWSWLVLPQFVAFGGLLWLLRPWAPSSYWPTFTRTLAPWDQSLSHWYWGLYTLGVPVAIGALYRRQPRVVAAVLWGLGAAGVGIALVRLNPFVQPRYFLPLATVAALSVCLVPWGRARALAAALLFVGVLAPDLAGLVGRGEPSFPPFRGVKVALLDAHHQSLGSTQPLHEALDWLSTLATPGESVLVDYVPQFVNWYLPQHPVALMPDLRTVTPRNLHHPMWHQTPATPQWHLWYPEWGTGIWLFKNRGDFWATPLEGERYRLYSRRLQEGREMCVVWSWTTDARLNAPFLSLTARDPMVLGNGRHSLVLARPCDAVAPLPLPETPPRLAARP